jgi:hypothetical protein
LKPVITPLAFSGPCSKLVKAVAAGRFGDNAKLMQERDETAVPLFGSWPRAYAAVIGCALLVMGLVALFSSWEY